MVFLFSFLLWENPVSGCECVWRWLAGVTLAPDGGASLAGPHRSGWCAPCAGGSRGAGAELRLCLYCLLSFHSTAICRAITACGEPGQRGPAAPPSKALSRYRALRGKGLEGQGGRLCLFEGGSPPAGKPGLGTVSQPLDGWMPPASSGLRLDPRVSRALLPGTLSPWLPVLLLRDRPPPAPQGS